MFPATLAFFSAFLLATVFLHAFGLYLGLRARRERDVGLGLGAALLFSAGVWTLPHAFQTWTSDPLLSLRLAQVEYVGVLALAPIWLAYVLWYTRRREAARHVLRAGGVISTLLFLVVATNDVHGLFYRSYAVRGAPIHSLAVTYGVAFPFVVVYLLFTLVATTVVLASAAATTHGVLRRQAVALLFVSLVPAVASIADHLGLSPVPGLNVTALSTIAVVVVGVVSVERFDWFEFHEGARDQVLRHLDEALVVVDGTGRVLDYNESATALADLTFGEPLYTHLPALAEPVTRARTQGERVQTETTLSDGSTYLTTVHPAEDDYWVVLLNDVTERTRAERRLRRQHEAIEGLHAVTKEVAAAPDLETVSEIVASGALSALDADACQVLSPGEDGFSVLGNAGDTPRSPAVDPSPVIEALQRDSSVLVGDLSHRSAAAAPTTVDGTAVPAYRSGLFVPIGNVGVVVALAHDRDAFDEYDRHLVELLTSHVESATNRLDAEEQLRQERDRLEEFAGVVSHDLRSPLNVAMGYIDVAREEREFEYLDRAEGALDRMDQLIDDLLTLAREGAVIGKVEPVSIATAAEEAWQSVQAPEAELVVADDLGTVEADPDRLVDAFVNLFRNAVEHAGPDVTVEVGRLDSGFYVADDGSGISPDDRERVFERGYTTSRTGTGFGLAIVREIAEAHGWEVSVTESAGERVTGGAQFEFRSAEKVRG